ncbi:MAG: fasciclin domain-containing protein [Myxococcales bacterium]|nr:MAG: fasciclin domain-containing protein [Myxococcales bacterium]
MKHLLWMGVALIAAQSIAACGGDDDDESPSTGGSAGASATAGKSSGGTSSKGGSSSASGSGGVSGEAPSASGGAGGAGGEGAVAEKDIVETALAAGNFTKLAAALTRAGLVDALKGDGPFTVFAPDDDAFQAFDDANPGVLAGLSKAKLTEILKYHVVAGAAVKSTALKDDQVFVTLSGSPVLVDTTGGVKVKDAEVKTPDVVASNGVIHVIDTIILPPEDDIVATAVAAGMFTQLAAALDSADLVTALQGPGPFTVFAPTDDAFDKLAVVPSGDVLKDVLLYHVVEGAVGSGDLTAGAVPTLLEDESVTIDLDDGVKVNDASVTRANIITKNGVIHVVDTVLVPE